MEDARRATGETPACTRSLAAHFAQEATRRGSRFRGGSSPS